MKKLAKSLITLTLVLVTMLSMLPYSHAASTASISTGTSYRNYVTCTLKNKKNAGYITIQAINKFNPNKTQRNSVRMETTKGRYIWEEKGAIACNGIRRFYLGNNNKAYRIKVKTYYGSGTALFYNAQNVNLTKNR